MSDNLNQLAEALVAAGHWMGSRGFLPATSGNLSARLDECRALVTASGGDKTALKREDLLEIAFDQPSVPRASAETPLHLALYRWRDDIGAVLHAHSRAATILSRRLEAAGQVRLSGYELVKALSGVRTHATDVVVPILANSQDMEQLARQLPERLNFEGRVLAPGFLLAGHGVYAWGQDVAEARRHLEALDFLFECELGAENTR